MATCASAATTQGAVDALRSGQPLQQGRAASQPHTLLPAPQWLSVPDLFLTGEATREVGLRFSPVMGPPAIAPICCASRAGPIRSWSAAKSWPAISRSLSFPASRSAAITSASSPSMTSAPAAWKAPIRFLIARVSGLSPTGMVHTQIGQLPIVSGPPSLPVSVLLDGDVPPAGAPSRGMHRLRVMVAGLMAEVPLSTTVPRDTPPPAGDPMVSPPPVAVVTPAPPWPGLPSRGAAAVPAVGWPRPWRRGRSCDGSPCGSPLSPASVNAEDVLLGGFGEVPPRRRALARARVSHIGARLNFRRTARCALAAGGRLLMRGGFGADGVVTRCGPRSAHHPARPPQALATSTPRCARPPLPPQPLCLQGHGVGGRRHQHQLPRPQHRHRSGVFQRWFPCAATSCPAEAVGAPRARPWSVSPSATSSFSPTTAPACASPPASPRPTSAASPRKPTSCRSCASCHSPAGKSATSASRSRPSHSPMPGCGRRRLQVPLAGGPRRPASGPARSRRTWSGWHRHLRPRHRRTAGRLRLQIAQPPCPPGHPAGNPETSETTPGRLYDLYLNI